MNPVVVLCQAWCLLDSPSLPLSWLPPLCVCLFSQLAAVVSLPPAARPCHLFGFCSSPMCFLHLPYDLHQPHAFECPHGGTCHSFLENIQDSGVEWQWVHLPCGRTGWDPGFADDPVLPFSIKHDLCLGWITLSFHGELGLTCAWKMASLMGRTMGIRGEKVPETRNDAMLYFKSITQTLSVFLS